MKITVLIDKDGYIIGTARSSKMKAGNVMSSMVAGPEERLEEIDLPTHLENATPEELHKGLKDAIK